MSKVVFVDFKPQASKKEHDAQYVTDRLKVAVTPNSVEITQHLQVPAFISITKHEFNAIVDLLEVVEFPKATVSTEEVLTPISQKVVQADFKAKTFKKAYKSEMVEKVTEAEKQCTVISFIRCTVFTWQNAEGRDCIQINSMKQVVGFYKETFMKLVEEAVRQDQWMECKVLEFKSAA